MNPSQQAAEYKPSIIRRTLYMTAIWTGFGVVIGAFDPRFTDRIGTIAAMIAWGIMLSMLGMFLGVVGGAYKDSVLGGVFGALVAALTAAFMRTDVDIAMQAIFGLLVGGIVGATCLPWLQAVLKSAKMMLKGVQWIATFVTPTPQVSE